MVPWCRKQMLTQKIVVKYLIIHLFLTLICQKYCTFFFVKWCRDRAVADCLACYRP